MVIKSNNSTSSQVPTMNRLRTITDTNDLVIARFELAKDTYTRAKESFLEKNGKHIGRCQILRIVRERSILYSDNSYCAWMAEALRGPSRFRGSSLLVKNIASYRNRIGLMFERMIITCFLESSRDIYNIKLLQLSS